MAKRFVFSVALCSIPPTSIETEGNEGDEVITQSIMPPAMPPVSAGHHPRPSESSAVNLRWFRLRRAVSSAVYSIRDARVGNVGNPCYDKKRTHTLEAVSKPVGRLSEAVQIATAAWRVGLGGPSYKSRLEF
jgi:hypothetical protein